MNSSENSVVSNLEFCDELQDNLKLKEFHGVRYALGTRFRQCENLSSVFDELAREVDGDEAVGLIKDLVILCGYGRLLKRDAYLQQRKQIHGDSFRIFHGSATFDEQEIKGMEERAVTVQVISRLIDNPKNWDKVRNYMYGFAGIPKKADRQLEDMYDELREFDEQKQLGITRLREILVKLKFRESEDIVTRFQTENEASTVRHEADGILTSAQKRTERKSPHKDRSITDDDCYIYIHKQQQNPPAATSGPSHQSCKHDSLAASGNQPQFVQSHNTIHTGGTQMNIMIPGGNAGNVTFNAPLVTIPAPFQLPPTTTGGGMMAPDGKSPAPQSPTRAKSPNMYRHLSQPEEETDKALQKSSVE